MNYRESVLYLDALQMHTIKLGLDAIGDFLATAGHPEKKCKFVHVAGTNGKGTICATLLEILSSSGYSVGFYSSPHLSSPRERFRIGNTYISEADFARLSTKISDLLQGRKITYFEFTTALAFLWFAERGVDLVLLETGMGGSFDATNVVFPLVSVISSISMDHEAYLGDTVEKIAREKAGIIKGGVPVVSGAQGVAGEVIGRIAEEKRAPLYRLHHEFDYQLQGDRSWDWRGEGVLGGEITGLQSQSPSCIQQENESLALAVIALLVPHGFRVAHQQIRNSLASLLWPGRMESFSSTVSGKNLSFLIDGAHNPAGVENLAVTIEARFPGKRCIAIWGSMADKDLTLMLSRIEPLFEAIIFTSPSGKRAAELEQLINCLAESARGKALSEPDVSKALTLAVDMATEDDLIVVGGSLYLVGEIRPILRGELAI